ITYSVTFREAMHELSVRNVQRAAGLGTEQPLRFDALQHGITVTKIQPRPAIAGHDVPRALTPGLILSLECSVRRKRRSCVSRRLDSGNRLHLLDFGQE